ncbi:MAG: SPASM domain-containing protein, partial [Candidatus Diapherotrites archaeon]|nr:SPASM domain-containing protein [Candidatus Diapherotrites archaeon]
LPDLIRVISKLDKKTKDTIKLDFGIVTNIYGRGANSKDIENRKEYHRKLLLAYRLADKAGLWKAKRPPFLAWSYNFCAADSAKGWWVDPDEKIYPCEHEVGRQGWTGTLKSGFIKRKQEKWEQQRLVNDPECVKCPKVFFCAGPCLSEKMNGKSYPPMHYVFEETMKEYVNKIRA